MTRHTTRTCVRYAAVVVGLLVAATVFAGPIGEIESAERELPDFDRLQVTVPGVSVEIVETRGIPRLVTRLNSRRELTVSARGGSIEIDVSRGWGLRRIWQREVVRLEISRGTIADIRAGSGSVDIYGVDFEDMRVDVGSGSVTVEDSRAPMTITVGSGRVELDDVTGALEISSGSGSIVGQRILLTDDSSFRTGSGRIDLLLDNAEEELSFDLDVGSGSIRVGAIRTSHRLRHGSGDIAIRGSSGSGSQEYQFR